MLCRHYSDLASREVIDSELAIMALKVFMNYVRSS